MEEKIHPKHTIEMNILLDDVDFYAERVNKFVARRKKYKTPEDDDCNYPRLQLTISPEGLSFSIEDTENDGCMCSFDIPEALIPRVINFMKVYLDAYNA